MNKLAVLVLALSFFLPACSSKTEKIRGEIQVSIPMERFLFKKATPVPFSVKTEGKNFSGFITEEQIEDETFELFWAVCDFTFFPTGKVDEDGDQIYRIETQSNCVSTLKE